MSYGVWKHKSGKNSPVKWSMIDLDNGSWGFDLWDRCREEIPKVYYMLGAQAIKSGLMVETWWGNDRRFRLADDSLPDDPAFVGWAVYQLRIGNTIYCMPNDGDHGVYFACNKNEFDTVVKDLKFIERVCYLPEESDEIGLKIA